MNDPFHLEIEDARARIKYNCGDPDEFSFTRQEQLILHDDYAAPCYTVIVECNGNVRHYHGGYGRDWVRRFEFDLYCDVFGQESDEVD